MNRDTLFSFHAASESFLHCLMALYVSSHYKNTPNDLQLLSDAPAHHVFVLVAPVLPSSTALPDILCVLQVRGWPHPTAPQCSTLYGAGVPGGGHQSRLSDTISLSWPEGGW